MIASRGASSRESAAEDTACSPLLPASFCVFWETRNAYRLRPRLAIGRCDNGARDCRYVSCDSRCSLNIVVAKLTREQSVSFSLSFFLVVKSRLVDRDFFFFFFYCSRFCRVETALLIRSELQHCIMSTHVRCTVFVNCSLRRRTRGKDMWKFTWELIAEHLVMISTMIRVFLES